MKAGAPWRCLFSSALHEGRSVHCWFMEHLPTPPEDSLLCVGLTSFFNTMPLRKLHPPHYMSWGSCPESLCSSEFRWGGILGTSERVSYRTKIEVGWRWLLGHWMRTVIFVGILPIKKMVISQVGPEQLWSTFQIICYKLDSFTGLCLGGCGVYCIWN